MPIKSKSIRNIPVNSIPVGNEDKTCTLHAIDDGLAFEKFPKPMWLLGDFQKSPEGQHINSLKQRKIKSCQEKEGRETNHFYAP